MIVKERYDISAPRSLSVASGCLVSHYLHLSSHVIPSNHKTQNNFMNIKESNTAPAVEVLRTTPSNPPHIQPQLDFFWSGDPGSSIATKSGSKSIALETVSCLFKQYKIKMYRSTFKSPPLISARVHVCTEQLFKLLSSYVGRFPAFLLVVFFSEQFVLVACSFWCLNLVI